MWSSNHNQNKVLLDRSVTGGRRGPLCRHALLGEGSAAALAAPPLDLLMGCSPRVQAERRPVDQQHRRSQGTASRTALLVLCHHVQSVGSGSPVEHWALFFSIVSQ